MKDVHTEHCCDKHGCKYGNDDCTVTTGRARQSHRCEDCEYDGRDIRPWGEYTVLLDEPTHKVKTITIKNGQRLSLQRHQKRSETWICVAGRLEVTVAATVDLALNNPCCTSILEVGERISFGPNTIHRARAIDGDATFIEVQLGTYFGEDDIERFEDDYGRK